MKITEISINIVRPQENLYGFASVVFDHSLKIACIAVVFKPAENKYTIIFPYKKVRNNTVYVHNPISNEFRTMLEEAIIKEFINQKERLENYDKGIKN